MQDQIIIKGARENNLKNVSLTIPRDKLVVFTGLSGSGKSSLAFDTIYAEGQRRYVESLSSYARQFLGQMDKPDVDSIDGLSPAISIDQKTTSRNPRSTVGTVTEIYDYLRLLWARVGTPHCPKCGKEIRRQSVDQIVDQVMTLEEGTRFQILAPVIRGKKGEHQKVFADAKKSGYVRVRVDGNPYDLSDEITLSKTKKHNIEIVVDRLVMKEDIVRRLTDSIETALHLSEGQVMIHLVKTDEILSFSQNYACEDCGISLPELEPRMFSFNNPYGACPGCSGLGYQLKVDPDLIMPNRSLSIMEGGIIASGWGNAKNDTISRMYYEALGRKYRFTLDTPLEKLSDAAIDALLYGTKGEKLKLQYDRGNGRGTLEQAFEGIVNNLSRRYRETQSDSMRRELEECMSYHPCPDCHGDRLSPIVLAVTVGGLNIMDFCKLSVSQELEFIDHLELTGSQQMIAAQILREIRSRLNFLRSVGLEYLTLSRAAGTLSGGESQRIRLATQIGSSLMGVLYILDEPSIGLHQRDNNKLLHTLRQMVNLGNTLIVVEHDEDTMREADYIVDVGPGAGIHGGEIVAAGTLQDIIDCPRSNPATYTGLFGDIRDLFASTAEAKAKGYGPGRFSFNVKGGRCEACSGDGLVKIEMHFLPDIYVPCDVCKGKRYNRETLEVTYKGKNISDVLDMTADEAVEFFENLPRIRRKVEALCQVGLGYIKLGQSSTTLSGGEAQRVKLATELSRVSTGNTFYILDEPTTGLHMADVHRLVEVLQALVDQGNTVLVIEHNLDVIKVADHLIDLGPEGGTGGGTIVCTGTPEEVAACEKSYTGQYLRPMLERDKD